MQPNRTPSGASPDRSADFANSRRQESHFPPPDLRNVSSLLSDPRIGICAEVVVVTTDAALGALISELHTEGIKAEALCTCRDAHLFIRHSPHLIGIIDDRLPEGRSIRDLLREFEVPILTLTDVIETVDRRVDSAELERGETVVRPISTADLPLRVKALMLRAGYELPTPAAASMASPPVEDVLLSAQRFAKTIAVFAAKAGVGKTTIAVNLAVGLQRMCGQRVLLVDAECSMPPTKSLW